MAKICNNCKTENKDAAKFCSKCGSKLEETVLEPVINTPVYQPPERRPEKPSEPVGAGIIIGIVVAVILLIAVIGIGIYIIFGKDFKTDSDESTKYTAETDIDEDKEDINDASGDSASAVKKAIADKLGGGLDDAFVDDLVEDTHPDPSSHEGYIMNLISEMNSSGYEEETIDVYADNYSPAPRDKNATWDYSVFYTMEGYIQAPGYYNKNYCILEKKQLRNAISGNIIQYEIYKNPDTGVANKIVSIEYVADGLEVMEYYFDNNKKISFIFLYNIDNYISTYATPDKPGERFLFSNDCLTTWRTISENWLDNFAVGPKEAKRLKGSFEQDTIHQYDSLNDVQKKQFDDVERNMINAAYNTYNIVLNSLGFASIQGYVYDDDNVGIEDAVIKLYTTDFVDVLFTTSTDKDGRYVIYVPNEDYDYNIKISKENRTSCNIYLIKVYNEQLSVYQDSVFLLGEPDTECDIELTLGDALNYSADGSSMVALIDAIVNVRSGLNNRSGEILATNRSDGYGKCPLRLISGVYTIEIICTGYENMYYTVVANPKKPGERYEFYAAPVLADGEIAIVLTWGYTPSDLDSHLFTTEPGADTKHIWYGVKSDSYRSYLDVDDTTSYGPETVTIRDFDTTKYYKYCVVDYTNCSYGAYSSMDMSYSGACINVYAAGGLAATFYVPTNYPGVIWEVFEIRNGVITPIQRYYNNVSDKTWWNSEK